MREGEGEKDGWGGGSKTRHRGQTQAHSAPQVNARTVQNKKKELTSGGGKKIREKLQYVCRENYYDKRKRKHKPRGSQPINSFIRFMYELAPLPTSLRQLTFSA